MLRAHLERMLMAHLGRMLRAHLGRMPSCSAQGVGAACSRDVHPRGTLFFLFPETCTGYRFKCFPVQMCRFDVGVGERSALQMIGNANCVFALGGLC